jgi:ATP-binding cassette, subfamily A (ABC1), member 3
MGLLRQTGTLIHKNITILTRHPISLVFFAFLLPIGLSIFYSFSQNLLLPPVTYGEGDVHPIRSLTEALRESQYRHRIVFANSGLEDGPIDRVIDSLASEAQAVDGFEVLRRRDQSALNVDCEPGSRAVTDCFGAVIFHGSPSEGSSGLWNYTILHDGATSGFRIHVDRNTNDQDLYLLPLQKAVDAAIASVATSNSSSTTSGPQPTDLSDTINRFPFTSLTPEQLRERVRELFQSSIINFLGITCETPLLLPLSARLQGCPF